MIILYLSNYFQVPRWPSATDQELLQAKLLIENAPVIDNDPILYSPLFRNVSVFKRWDYDVSSTNSIMQIARSCFCSFILHSILQKL